MGVLICEDLWHISLPYLLAIDGATIIAGLAASPTRISTDSEELTNYKIVCKFPAFIFPLFSWKVK